MMNSEQWYLFFNKANEILGEGSPIIDTSQSWCAWTTFSRLECWDAGYWKAGLPHKQHIEPWGIADGGVWGQPFKFSDIAHLIVPHKFCTEMGEVKHQNTSTLLAELGELADQINMNEYVLEIKLY